VSRFEASISRKMSGGEKQRVAIFERWSFNLKFVWKEGCRIEKSALFRACF
jgi:ABC-type lipoprotein export system ATPase subunit